MRHIGEEDDRSTDVDLAAKVDALTEQVARYEAAERARLLTMTEAAARLGINRATLLTWVKQGRVPASKVGRRHVIPAWWVADKLAVDLADMQARADLRQAVG
ncbi:MAG: helix-turn-helix domain-containing protein [Acidimicrobiales bacterium]